MRNKRSVNKFSDFMHCQYFDSWYSSFTEMEAQSSSLEVSENLKSIANC